MSATTYIVRMKNIQSKDPAFFSFCYCGICLCFKKRFTIFHIQEFFLWKCNTFIHNFIPYFYHLRQIIHSEFTNIYAHFFSPDLKFILKT